MTPPTLGGVPTTDAADFAVTPDNWGDCTDWLGDWNRHKWEERLHLTAAKAHRRTRPHSEGDHRHQLPDDAIAAGRAWGASEDQIRKAEAMIRRGLSAKGKRQAVCAVLGAQYDCSDTGCRKRFFRRYGCKCRYCLRCGPSAFRELFSKYVRLKEVADSLARGSYVVAKIDFTAIKLGRMPTRDEVREFNRCIKRFCRLLERKLGFDRKRYGLIYCNEFGRDNTNLHAHGLYVGPRLPRPKTANGLDQLWFQACDGTTFAGSKIVSVKRANNFAMGLAHALKYTSKILSYSPSRLADLELAFHGVRRVHTLAAFYHALKTAPEGEGDTVNCPDCGAALIRVGPWQPVEKLHSQGCWDFDACRRAAARDRGLTGTPRAGPV